MENNKGNEVRISQASKEELEELERKLGPPGRKYKASRFAYSFYEQMNRPHRIINRRGEFVGWSKVREELKKRPEKHEKHNEPEKV